MPEPMPFKTAQDAFSFMKVLHRCAQDRGLLTEYDRLHGTNLLLQGAPLDLMVDKATGRPTGEFRHFADFVRETFWRPLEDHHL